MCMVLRAFWLTTSTLSQIKGSQTKGGTDLERIWFGTKLPLLRESQQPQLLPWRRKMRNKNTAGLSSPNIQELQLKQKPGDSQVDKLEPALPQRQTQPDTCVKSLASSGCSCPTPWQTAPHSPQLPPNPECVSCGTGAADESLEC